MQATAILDRNGRHCGRNAYLLKIGAESFGDGIQLISKDTESNLRPFAGFKGCNYPELSFLQFERDEGHKLN